MNDVNDKVATVITAATMVDIAAQVAIELSENHDIEVGDQDIILAQEIALARLRALNPTNNTRGA